MLSESIDRPESGAHAPEVKVPAVLVAERASCGAHGVRRGRYVQPGKGTMRIGGWSTALSAARCSVSDQRGISPELPAAAAIACGGSFPSPERLRLEARLDSRRAVDPLRIVATHRSDSDALASAQA
jgi:hypothetical protein